MNKFFSIIFLFLSTSIFSQIKTDWLELRDVHYKSQYSEEYDSYFQVPFFGKNIEALNNKEVTITGYMLTLAPDEGVYVLSQNPYADCFFCGYGGPETAIELVLKPGHDDFLMDELVTVTGKFKLLYDDVTSGVYRLTDAVAFKE